MECIPKNNHDTDKKENNESKRENIVFPAIGIDLGTTYSCVGVYRHGRVEIIANDQGNRTTPSYVAFTDNERLIGESAKSQCAMNAANTFYDVKRLIGRRLNDIVVQSDMKHLSYSLVEDANKLKISTTYRGVNKNLVPEEISAMILVKMRRVAENYLDMSIRNAVITVPAYFNNEQRQATKDAGIIAGLNVLRVINEPTAAALAYGFDKRIRDELNVLVFDLGGGTFDVSILTIEEGVFEVKSIAGNTHLGGEDFDTRLVEHFALDFEKKHGKDLRANPRSMRRLRTACETAKHLLSTSTEATVDIESLFEGMDYRSSISRARFEELNNDLFAKTLESVKLVLKDANMQTQDIQEIILVGGSTRIPKVRKLLQDFFPSKILNKSINADEAVAYGATILAASLQGEINQDSQGILLLDVIPLSLGIEILGDKMSTIIHRNTTIPAKQTKKFFTSIDNQSCTEIKIFEGERAIASENNLLGLFIVKDIPLSLRGIQSIYVTYEIDVDGILNVTAVLKSTGQVNKIAITNEERKSGEQLEEMIADAERYKQDDIAFLKRIEAMNKLENYTYEIRTSTNNDYYDIAHGARTKMLDKCATTIQWLEDNRSADLDMYTDLLSQMEKLFSNYI